MRITRLAAGAWVALALSAAPAAAPPCIGPVPAGQACAVYLGHAGWLVRTAEHALVFDYTGPPHDGPLDRGALEGIPSLLFVSHAHGDHYQPQTIELARELPGAKVVLGWREPRVNDAIVPADGTWTEIAGAGVFALHHDYDGIPEGFFLVRSGGIVIYHSGDHGTWSDPPHETFRHNIERLAAAAKRLDLAFLSSFGRAGTRTGLNAGDDFTLRTLKPRVTFPMHCGGCEERYVAFAEEAEAREVPTTVALAEAPGVAFRYADGTVFRIGAKDGTGEGGVP